MGGFTLVELMIAMGISGIILVTLLVVTYHSTRSISSLTDSLSINSESRYAIDRMSQKVRQATNVLSFSSSSIAVRVNGRTLSYFLSNGTLMEAENGKTNRLVRNCNHLQFSLYQRNNITNTFDQFPMTGVTNLAKAIQVRWTCSTTRVGKSAGIGELCSAKIIFRAK